VLRPQAGHFPGEALGRQANRVDATIDRESNLVYIAADGLPRLKACRQITTIFDQTHQSVPTPKCYREERPKGLSGPLGEGTIPYNISFPSLHDSPGGGILKALFPLRLNSHLLEQYLRNFRTSIFQQFTEAQPGGPLERSGAGLRLDKERWRPFVISGLSTHSKVISPRRSKRDAAGYSHRTCVFESNYELPSMALP
jgi:hypothetical protein